MKRKSTLKRHVKYLLILVLFLPSFFPTLFVLFSAFEYGSTFEYHGMYNTQGEDDDQNDENKEATKHEPKATTTDFDDLDELLQGLTEEELKELSVIDPDVNRFHFHTLVLEIVSIFCLGFKRSCQHEMFVPLRKGRIRKNE